MRFLSAAALMNFIEPVDPYRSYLYLPEANAAMRVGGSPPRHDSLREFYGDADREVVTELQELIRRSHQIEVLLGQRHFAPSPTWRDEYLMDHGYQYISRFAVRVHIFEKLSPGVAGRYLGFASLRPPGSKKRQVELCREHAQNNGEVDEEEEEYRWVIEAELGYPTHMQRPRYHIIATTASSARLGVLPFRSTVYMSPNLATPGSSCTHVALSQALHLVMGRFGSRAISQREFEMLLWPDQGRSYMEIRMEGANLPQALEVVRKECHGGGFLAFFPAPTRGNDQEAMVDAHRCLTDTLANGLPVILDVDAEVLADPEFQPPAESTAEEEEERRKNMAHAILIFGMRLISSSKETLPSQEHVCMREDMMELPGRFVGHDTALGPFSEWSTRPMLKAALAAYPEGDERRGIYMLALGPASMRLGMDDVRNQCRVQMTLLAGGNALQRGWCEPFLQAAGITLALDPEQDPWRYVIRLLGRSEIRRRYEDPVPAPSTVQGISKEEMQRLNQGLDSLSPESGGAHYWCVEIHWGGVNGEDPESRVKAAPMLVLFFHAGEDKDERPSLRFALLRWREGRLEYVETPEVLQAQMEAPPAPAEAREMQIVPRRDPAQQLPRMPEVSLITSWYLPPPLLHARAADDAGAGEPPLPSTLEALRIALNQQMGLLDLYFLDDSDVAWYWQILNEEEPMPEEGYPSALKFAAGLTPPQVKKIADALSGFVAKHYEGRLVGPRPRFAALATYWPHLSMPQEWSHPCLDMTVDPRPEESVKAVRNALLLASHLGCRHVEIVGGSALPELKTRPGGEPLLAEQLQSEALQKALRDKNLARKARHDTLVKNLAAVYTDPVEFHKPDGERRLWAEFAALREDGRDGVPKLCLEVEPGKPFLINSVECYVEVRRDLLKKHPLIANHVLLNVDIAHMMLCEGDEQRAGAHCQMEVICRGGTLGNIKHLIGHMHVSDHARTHASDLTPGTYHFFHDFLPWLKLAIELTADPESNFSGVIAVEMETCADIHEAARSVGRIRRWLEAAPHFDILPPAPEGAPLPPTTPISPASSPAATPAAPGDSSADGRMMQAAIVVVDVGNSTRWALTSGAQAEGATPSAASAEDSAVAIKIEKMVNELCQKVHAQRGSVLSFTGDGAISVFDPQHFSSDEMCARAALRAGLDMADGLRMMIQEENDPRTIRVSLHWGRVYLPTTGALRFQAIGRDVILACRLCGAVKKLERQAGGTLRARLACTGSFSDVFTTALDPLLEDMADFAPEGFQDSTEYERMLQAYSVDEGKLRKFLEG